MSLAERLRRASYDAVRGGGAANTAILLSEAAGVIVIMEAALERIEANSRLQGGNPSQDGEIARAVLPKCPWCGIFHRGSCARLISGGQSD